jgi:hypothetical protein
MECILAKWVELVEHGIWSVENERYIRMPLAERDYMRKDHPPACTSVSCERKRSARLYRKPLAKWKSMFDLFD